MDLNVRDLQEKDFWRLFRIISHASQGMRQTLTQAVAIGTGADGQQQAVVNKEALVFAILDAMTEQEQEIRGFLADMVGLKPDKFDQLPFGASLDILTAIIEQDGAADFLSKLVTLTSRVSDKL